MKLAFSEMTKEQRERTQWNLAHARRLRESKEDKKSNPKKKDSSNITLTGALSVGLQPFPTEVTPHRKESNNMSDKISHMKKTRKKHYPSHQNDGRS